MIIAFFIVYHKIIFYDDLLKKKTMYPYLFSIFKKHKNLIIGFSRKRDGSMKLTGDFLRDKTSFENRQRFFEKLGIKLSSIVSAGLIHSNNVQIVDIGDAGKIIPDTDGLITNSKGIFLSITVADCLPVFFYDDENKVIALSHAGWRGLHKNILQITVEKMNKSFGSKPQDILVGIGPSISKCHYEIGKDLKEKFDLTSREIFVKRKEKTFLDLKKVGEIQLLNVGIKKQNIEISQECTFCMPHKYFSYRRDKPKIVQAMIAVIGMK